MGCLFSKTAAEDGLLAGAPPPTASDAGGGLAPGEAAVAAEPAAAASDGVTFNSRPTAIASSSSPDVLKPMGRGGFADITTGIQEQLGRCARFLPLPVVLPLLFFSFAARCCFRLAHSWKAPLNPSETGEEGTRYVTNENASELKLGATLGKGNYGVVHAATWRDREVAVKKVLMPENMRAEQQRRLVEDFKCEVDICCRLTHPRLVAFLGYTTAPDLCIVQELMQQGSLYDQFQRGWRANTLQQQLVLAHDVARGMAYLHAWRPPLIHRDLKSLNILLSAGEKDASGVAMARCKVTDFGMTRAKALGQPTAEDTAAAGATPADVMTLAMTRCAKK